MSGWILLVVGVCEPDTFVQRQGLWTRYFCTKTRIANEILLYKDKDCEPDTFVQRQGLGSYKMLHVQEVTGKGYGYISGSGFYVYGLLKNTRQKVLYVMEASWFASLTRYCYIDQTKQVVVDKKEMLTWCW